MKKKIDMDADIVVVPGTVAALHTLLDVRGHALDVAAAHYRTTLTLTDDDATLHALVTADAAAYERYLLTGAVTEIRSDEKTR